MTDKQLTTFNYDVLDASTAKMLRAKESEIDEALSTARLRIGKALKEAQDILAGSNQYNGVFEKWYTSKGLKRQTVYDCIGFYNLLLQNPEKQSIVEELPFSLGAALSAPSAESTEPKRKAKAAVLNGDIRTLKEYRELVAKLEEAEQQAQELAEQNETLRHTVESLAATPPPPPRIEVKREVIADPDLAARLKRYEAKYGDIDGQVTERITNFTEVTGAVEQFADDVQTLLLNYAHLTTYRSTFRNLPDEAYDEYRTTLDALKDFVDGMEKVLSSTPKGSVDVIDISSYKVI